mmetsp:Transcript_95941/g.133198  ORF Transcript_95941/g.133198 Transcript_95941/m.133198 type:complete len:100 (-) Transcript_95941:86-385(-)
MNFLTVASGAYCRYPTGWVESRDLAAREGKFAAFIKMAPAVSFHFHAWESKGWGSAEAAATGGPVGAGTRRPSAALQRSSASPRQLRREEEGRSFSPAG